jgi:hypothetical protein
MRKHDDYYIQYLKDMPKDELYEFIKESKNSGMTDEQIRVSFNTHGWPGDEIEEGIKTYYELSGDEAVREITIYPNQAKPGLLKKEIEADIGKNVPSIDNVNSAIIEYAATHFMFIEGLAFIAIFLDIVTYLLSKEPLLLIVWPLSIFVLGYQIVKISAQNEFMKQFARSIGFKYSKKGSLEGMDGSMFKFGRSKSVFNMIKGRCMNYPLSIFNYAFTVGYGRGSRRYVYTVYKLQLSTKMPNILLKSSYYRGPELTEVINDEIFVKLEGDFNEYFSLYVLREFEIEALQLLSPDVMHYLIETAKPFNLEFVESDLYIFSQNQISAKPELYRLYGITRYLIDKLGDKINKMRPDLKAMDSAYRQYQEKKRRLFSGISKKAAWTTLNIMFAIAIFGIQIYAGSISRLSKTSIQNEKNMAYQIIDIRSDSLQSVLQKYFDSNGKYPQGDIKEDMAFRESFFLDDYAYAELERQYLGRKINFSDFTYHSDGKSYELCINMADLKKNKCWKK